MAQILWKIKAGRMSYEEYYIVAPTMQKACNAAVEELAESKGKEWQADHDDISSVEKLRTVKVVS